MKKQIILLTLLVSAVITLLNAAQDETEQVAARKGFDRKDRIRQAIHKQKKEDLDVFFTNDEYNKYMAVIKKIDPIAYNELKECEVANSKPCLQKALTSKDVKFTAATSETFGYSKLILLPATFTNPRNVSQVLDVYKEDTPHYFSKAEYDEYMDQIQKIDPIAYDDLKKCEITNARPCLQKGLYTDTDIEEALSKEEFPEDGISKIFKEGSFNTHWYPTLALLPGMIFDTNFLSYFLDLYKEQMPLSEEERKKVLDVIHVITPELYNALIAIDPSGVNHITRHSDDTSIISASVYPSSEDGFPIIGVGRKLMDNPSKYYAIGHELGHYALHHFNNKQEVSLAGIIAHKNRFAREHDLTFNDQTPLKVSGQLDFKDTFNKASSRTDEDEADRFAIVDLKIPFTDDVIATLHEQALEEDQDYSEENPKEKDTLKRTHPFSEKRIEHMKSLSREVELHKRRYGNQSTPIDWQGLARNYKKELQ